MITIRISLKTVWIFSFILGILILGVGVYAYGNPGNPPAVGHTMGEIMPSCTGIVAGVANTANSIGCYSIPPVCTGSTQGLSFRAGDWECKSLS